jgi:hypothetical protein
MARKRGRGRTGLQAGNLLVVALVVVALGDDGRNVAAGLAVAVLGGHGGRHFGGFGGQWTVVVMVNVVLK